MGNAIFTPDDTVPTVFGSKRVRTGRITLSNSYATGGDTLQWKNVSGLVYIDSIIINPSKGYALEPDIANNKVKAYSAANTEVTNATDLSTVVAEVIIIGR